MHHGTGEKDNNTTRFRRELTMSQSKFALYLGAVFSTLFRVSAYIFLRVVCFFVFPLVTCLTRGRFSFPLDGVDICFPASISLMPRRFPSHLDCRSHRHLPLHHLTQRKTGQPRLPLTTRQASPFTPTSSPPHSSDHLHRLIKTKMFSGNCYSPYRPLASHRS